LALLRASTTTLPSSAAEAEALTKAIEAASVPAAPEQIATEVMVILSAFYVENSAEALRNRMVEIWFIHLDPFPIWAIKAAAEWWLGPQNGKRRSRPIPGDIAERCEVEMQPVRTAERAVRWWRQYEGKYPDFIRRGVSAKGTSET
jgi:hypothetical protein